jgi:hypothetical protein
MLMKYTQLTGVLTGRELLQVAKTGDSEFGGIDFSSI